MDRMTRRSLLPMTIAAAIPVVAKVAIEQGRDFYSISLGDFGKVFLDGVEVQNSVWCSVKHGAAGRYVTDDSGRILTEFCNERIRAKRTIEFGTVRFVPNRPQRFRPTQSMSDALKDWW